MKLGSSATIDEKLKLGMPITADDVDELQGQNASLQKELESEERGQEIISEQLYFAKELLDALETGLEEVTSAKQARELFARLCQESSLER